MDFPLHIPFVEHLQLQLLALADGRAELLLAVQRHQTNNGSVAHGGVVMTLLDVAMAHAARTMAGQASTAAALPVAGAEQTAQLQQVVTIEMKTSFMRPSRGQLRAVGRLLHRTSSLAFCEGSVVNADGQLCAHASGTFKYLRDTAAQASTKA